jgi:DNA repair protein RecO (recombination protein O)
VKQHKDRAIVLSRVDYGERDRILTLLCQRQGKLSVLAKAVRSQKSRLAGGIELLSESEISYIEGKSSIMVLTSARLSQHFGQLVKDMPRMQRAFAHIKVINSIADDASGQEYYDTLLTSLASLNDPAHEQRIVDIWFNLRVLRIYGSAPDLQLEASDSTNAFEFDYDRQQFRPSANGLFTRNDLKLLRLCTAQSKPPKIQNPLTSEDRLQALTQALVKSNAIEL